MHKRNIDISLLVLLVGVSVVLFFIFAPFLAVLSLAAVFAVFFHRPYERLVRLFGGWHNSAALLTVASMLVLFIVPLFFLGMQILKEAQTLFVVMRGNETAYMHLLQGAIENPVQQLFPGFTFDVQTAVENALIFISNNLGALVYQTLYVALDTFLMLLTLFFFLRDGRGILASLVNVSPLGEIVTNGILNNMYRTIRSVVEGTLANALIRWLCIWIAFSLFGIPNALLWSSVGGIIGAIPGLGTPFSFIGAIVYLYLQSGILPAAGLTIFGIAVILLVDNILTSYFFGKGLDVSPLFVLFSILGGIIFFGPPGFILGPLVLTVFISVVRASTLADDVPSSP